MFPRKIITLMVVLSVFALAASAQTSPLQHHDIDANVTVIDGSKNPELIPDSTAYRLYLVTISELPNATAKDRTRQQSHLGMIGLQEIDRQRLITVLADFKSQYLALIDRYNQSATAALARNEQPNQNLFSQQRDDLVQSTRDALKLALTANGMARFNAQVQAEKAHMKIHTTNGGQQ